MGDAVEDRELLSGRIRSAKPTAGYGGRGCRNGVAAHADTYAECRDGLAALYRGSKLTWALQPKSGSAAGDPHDMLIPGDIAVRTEEIAVIG